MLFKVVICVVTKLCLDWLDDQYSFICSVLDDYFPTSGHMLPLHRKLPFFPDLHSEVIEEPILGVQGVHPLPYPGARSLYQSRSWPTHSVSALAGKRWSSPRERLPKIGPDTWGISYLVSVPLSLAQTTVLFHLVPDPLWCSPEFQGACAPGSTSALDSHFCNLFSTCSVILCCFRPMNRPRLSKNWSPPRIWQHCCCKMYLNGF